MNAAAQLATSLPHITEAEEYTKAATIRLADMQKKVADTASVADDTLRRSTQVSKCVGLLEREVRVLKLQFRIVKNRRDVAVYDLDGRLRNV